MVEQRAYTDTTAMSGERAPAVLWFDFRDIASADRIRELGRDPL